MADGFLGRWSRRKQEVREGKPVEEPLPPLPPPSAPVASPAGDPASTAQGGAVHGAPPAAEPPPLPTLADAQALTPASDFQAFVARGVPPDVRNLAMKKLFADPHFNAMDGLDIYIGDYTQPDPLPEGMLRKMTSAHAMGFFDDEKKAQTEASPGGPASGVSGEAHAGVNPSEQAIAPAIAQSRETAGEKEAPDVAQFGVCNAIPSGPSSEPEMVARSDESAVAMPASHSQNDHDAHLRLQPDDAPQRQGVGRGSA